MPSRKKQTIEEEELLDDEVDAGEAEKALDVNHELRRLIDPDFAEKFVATLHHAVQVRVKALQGMQGSMNEIREKYMEEHKALERKYEALYAPIFSKRLEIISGEREPTPAEIAMGQGDDFKEPEDANQDSSDAKGIPDFWLTALKNHDSVSEIIEERDEPCLKFLTNITAKSFEDPDTGFTLEFHFAENPYFTNTMLTKTYHLVDEDEIVLDKAEGCEIDWKTGQNLTVVMKKKKQRSRGGKQTRQITKEEPCDSFFNFFKPPQIPEDVDEDEDDDDMGETMEELVEQDYEIGCAIKDQIVPKAVNWYTGEAADHDDDDDEEDEDDDDHSDEDEDEDESPPPRKAGKKPAKEAPKKAPGDGAAAQPECKQQ